MAYRSNLPAALALVEEAKAAGATAMVSGAGTDSKELVPVDTGALLGSKKIIQNEDGSAKVTYGGPGAEHAVVVHNKPGVNYRRGQWQFLRQPLMDKKRRLDDASKAVKEIFK